MDNEKIQGHFLLKLFESEEVDDVFDEGNDEPENLLSEQQDEEIYSDSDQDYEYSDDDDEPPEKKIKCDHYIGRDKITKWMKKQPNLEFKPTECVPSKSEFGPYPNTVLESWEQFFPDEMLEIIVTNTNKYIGEISSHSSRERDARPIDIIELKAVIGLLYMSGFLKSSRLNVNELWEQNGFGVERFWLTMSKHRFLFIMRCIHFADQEVCKEYEQKDKLVQIRDIMNIFINRCQEMYIPSELVTVGEILISFRGSCPFKQYVPSKAKRYGIRMFALVDSKIPYTKNLEIDVDHERKYRVGVTDAKNVMERLIKPISGSFRNVTGNKRFTSFEMIDSLWQDHQLTYVGSVRKSRIELPKELVNTKRRPTHSSLTAFKENTKLMSYIPETGKCLLVASSMPDPPISSSKSNNEPNLISFYNSTKGAVEVVEQFASTYDVSRFTKRWPVIVFYSFLNIGAINSYLIYLQNNATLFRRVYLKQLAIELTQEHLKRRAMQKNIPPGIRQRRREVAGIVDDEPKGDPTNPNLRRRCCWCKNKSKTRFYCHHCGKFICLKHSNFVCVNCI